MSLSSRTKKYFRILLGDKQASTEISSAIDGVSGRQSELVEDLGALIDVPALLADAASKADLDLVQAKVDELLAALKAAGLMLEE